METNNQPAETIYYINPTTRTALVRVSDTVCQRWQALGNTVSADSEFDHRHWQTVWPSKERLDDLIKNDFQPSTMEEYLSLQFEHHQLDDYFRQKANTIKQKLFEEKQTITV
jgi:hypothetical protein